MAFTAESSSFFRTSFIMRFFSSVLRPISAFWSKYLEASGSLSFNTAAITLARTSEFILLNRSLSTLSTDSGRGSTLTILVSLSTSLRLDANSVSTALSPVVLACSSMPASALLISLIASLGSMWPDSRRVFYLFLGNFMSSGPIFISASTIAAETSGLLAIKLSRLGSAAKSLTGGTMAAFVLPSSRLASLAANSGFASLKASLNFWSFKHNSKACCRVIRVRLSRVLTVAAVKLLVLLPPNLPFSSFFRLLMV
mmetsp:Transcript_10368/g.22848  ORF Transcript_10368/g.22848 Transcript_10368/m.22848 type:complete len:255 (+) Transcript_10368:1344-2108(+)